MRRSDMRGVSKKNLFLQKKANPNCCWLQDLKKGSNSQQCSSVVLTTAVSRILLRVSTYYFGTGKYYLSLWYIR